MYAKPRLQRQLKVPRRAPTVQLPLWCRRPDGAVALRHLCPRGASLMISSRGAGHAAARRAAAERQTIHLPLRHLHIRTGKQGQPVYPRLSPSSPVPRAAAAADALLVQARSR